MRVCIHRGAKQIGGTCVDLAEGKERIVIDLGLPLDAESADASLVPPIVGDSASPLKAVIISHPHLDHYGLAHHLPGDVPVYMGAAAQRIIEAAAPFTRQAKPSLTGPALADRQPLDIGPFHITPFLVDHAAYDAYSLLVEAGGRRLFYSGDFRAHGRKAALFDRFLAHPPSNIDVLLMEGSSLTRLADTQRFPTESEIEQEFVMLFDTTPGMTLVCTSAQNIDRMVTLYRACKRTGRELVIDLYTAAVFAATENLHIPQSNWPGVRLFVPQRQRVQVKENQWFDLLRQHESRRIYPEALAATPSRFVMLFRPMMRYDLERAKCLGGAFFIYSQWEGYLEKDGMKWVRDWLAKQKVPMKIIHTSGHASVADLKRYCQALAPKRLVPIHSFAPERYPELFANVEPHGDGEWWDV